MPNIDYPIASDLSQQVLEVRRLRGELRPEPLDSVNRRLYPLPCAMVVRESFIADRAVVVDTGKPEHVRHE